jgi:GAF domain-containing protein
MWMHHRRHVRLHLADERGGDHPGEVRTPFPDPSPSRTLTAELDEVTDTLDRLVDILDREEGLDIVLDRLVRTALLAIDGADAVTVTIHDEDGPRTVSATTPHVLPVDEVQYAAGEGPDLEAAKTRDALIVSLADPDTATRWPEFTEAAQAAGVWSYLAVPLVFPAVDDGDTELVGSLNAYSHGKDAFAPVDRSLLQLLTAAAVAAAGNARRYLRSRTLARQLRNALDTRPGIEQAKGALMAIHGVDAAEAFGMLVERSQRENLKLREVAERFLTHLDRARNPGNGQGW